jgi:hypothetical protein
MARHLMLVLMCMIASARPEATVLVPVDLEELSREAHAIVRGRVVAIESRWTDDRRTIETVVTLVAEASLKGPNRTTVQFVVPGGRVGRYRTIVLGAPEFVLDERVFVFLGWHNLHDSYVLGLNQGVFRVAPGSDGSWVVTPPPLIVPPTGSVRIVRGNRSRRPMPLADFETQVRALVGAQR